MHKALSNIKIKRIEALRKDDVLFKKVLRIAQFESELDMGVNPKDFEQAKVSYLTTSDFEYIKKVCVLVKKRLKNSDWLEKTLDTIEHKFSTKSNPIGGLKFDNELFKAGRGILESYLKDLKES